MAGEDRKSGFVYRDLREWMEKADAAGNLRRVEGASWEADIGNITEMLHHSFPAPAVLFDKVPGCDPGFRLLTNVCLLYTSPSPRDRTRSRMPSSA